MSAADLDLVQPADWLGYPQAGWVRLTFDVPSDGVVQRGGLGERVYWRQENAWSAPVEISESEYEAFSARVNELPADDLKETP